MSPRLESFADGTLALSSSEASPKLAADSFRLLACCKDEELGGDTIIYVVGLKDGAD